MDIFNTKRVAELEAKLMEVEKSRDKYMQEAAILVRKLETLSELTESVPEDCVRGPWCKACEFVRAFHHYEYYGSGLYGNMITSYACSKGASCKNFIQKGD